MNWAPDQSIGGVLPISFNLHSAFGAAQDADSAPAYRVYEMTTATPILTGTLSTFDASNTDGFYNGAITLSAANGFEVGKTYKLRVSAVVDGVTGADVTMFRVVDPMPSILDDFYNRALAGIFGKLNTNTANTTGIYPTSINTDLGAVTGTVAALHAEGGDTVVLTEVGDTQIAVYFEFDGTVTSEAAGNFAIRIKADPNPGATYDILAYNTDLGDYEAVGEFAADGAYHTVGFTLAADNYTGGDASLGVHASVATDSTITVDYLGTYTGETVSEQVDGIEGGGGGGAAVPPDLARTLFTWQLKPSGSGAYTSTNVLVLTPDTEDYRAGVNCRINGILPAGLMLDEMTEPTSSSEDNVTATKTINKSHDGYEAKMLVNVPSDAEPNEGDGVYYLTTMLTNSAGDGPIPVHLKVRVEAAPE